ncbi:hypothetical protein SAY87_001497 [Trapa incisa]|uniref:F-box domain-containing protein n=1 Tax=Trapa incisa TaxID=236973 RepID=A0AAN7JAG7_9MYRT|nr:hypothetical protein SAY87_001497 [Trapa incisa]
MIYISVIRDVEIFLQIIMDVAWDIGKVDDDLLKETDEFDSSDHSDEGNQDAFAVSLDIVLPDDLLERILSFLPVASIFRAGSVCRRWHGIVSSKRFQRNLSHVLPQKPWYFMFTSSHEPCGYAYDPILKKWYGIDLACIESPNWFVASSSGLVSFMDNDSRSQLYVCNPITKRWRKLGEPPGLKFSDYSALAISVDRSSNYYKLSVVKSKQVPDNFSQWELSIHIYESKSMVWTTFLTEVLAGWRGGDESVICGGVLYFLIYSTVTRGGRHPDNRHGLMMYDISTHSSGGPLLRSFISMPCPLTCGRLMNLRDKLVMVGGIGKHDKPGIIKGIGIWVLHDKEWQEMAKMPHKFFQGFGEIDDVFASSGYDDLIFIQSYGGPALLVFDMNQKQWRWSQRSPVTKRFPLQLYSGFCFEPRLDIEP